MPFFICLILPHLIPLVHESEWLQMEATKCLGLLMTNFSSIFLEAKSTLGMNGLMGKLACSFAVTTLMPQWCPAISLSLLGLLLPEGISESRHEFYQMMKW